MRTTRLPGFLFICFLILPMIGCSAQKAIDRATLMQAKAYNLVINVDDDDKNINRLNTIKPELQQLADDLKNKKSDNHFIYNQAMGFYDECQKIVDQIVEKMKKELEDLIKNNKGVDEDIIQGIEKIADEGTSLEQDEEAIAKYKKLIPDNTQKMETETYFEIGKSTLNSDGEAQLRSFCRKRFSEYFHEKENQIPPEDLKNYYIKLNVTIEGYTDETGFNLNRSNTILRRCPEAHSVCSNSWNGPSTECRQQLNRCLSKLRSDNIYKYLEYLVKKYRKIFAPVEICIEGTSIGNGEDLPEGVAPDAAASLRRVCYIEFSFISKKIPKNENGKTTCLQTKTP